LETLPLRVTAQCQRAGLLADHLATSKAITSVLYPFHADHPQHALAKRQMTLGGQIVTFTLRGGKPAAFGFLNALRLIKISNNLGDAKSLITHPSTTTHQRLKPEARVELGITDGMLRLSVGLEHINDLIADINAGLAAAAPT
jgi:O-succinylhomoserine sulfhydrylase